MVTVKVVSSVLCFTEYKLIVVDSPANSRQSPSGEKDMVVNDLRRSSQC